MFLLQFFKLFWICLEGIFPPFLFCFFLLWFDVYLGYTTFLDWKAPYCQHKYTTQGNMQTQCNPYQITNVIFHKASTRNSKPYVKTQETLNSQAILKNENGTGEITPRDFILKPTLIKMVCYWHKNRNTDVWNHIENPEINSWTYGQLIYVKGKNIQWRKDNIFSKCCWEMRQLPEK